VAVIRHIPGRPNGPSARTVTAPVRTEERGRSAAPAAASRGDAAAAGRANARRESAHRAPASRRRRVARSGTSSRGRRLGKRGRGVVRGHARPGKPLPSMPASTWSRSAAIRSAAPPVAPSTPSRGAPQRTAFIAPVRRSRHRRPRPITTPNGLSGSNP
jgi:hypothetical protein